MAKETETFLSLYRTYEGLLREHGADYRAVEETHSDTLHGRRMTIMRQMRNYLAHSEDPGFIAVSPACLKALEQMVKEESLKGDIVKNHLIPPAKRSVKEGTPLSQVVYRLSVLARSGVFDIPVYDAGTKRLKGLVSLEKAALELSRHGDMPLTEETCTYGTIEHIVKPDDPVPKGMDGEYYCCTKDGTLESQYMGFLDK